MRSNNYLELYTCMLLSFKFSRTIAKFRVLIPNKALYLVQVMLDFESHVYLNLSLLFVSIFIKMYLGLVKEGKPLGQILHSDVYFENVNNVKISQITPMMTAIFNLAGMLHLKNTLLA